MKTTYFYILFLIVALPALAQDTLLEKASDGSTLITKQNAWAVLRGRIGTYDNSYLTAERVATLMWGDQLNGIVDQFEHHAALEKKVKLLDDASAAAKSIDAVTFVFDPALGKYDFDSQSFPIIQAFGSDGTRMCPGSTYVCFDQKLIPNIAVPEAQAQALAKAVHDNGGSIEITVKATIKECRPTTPKEQGRVIGWQAKSAEEEPCDATMYKVILSVRSVEYRLKNPGTVLLTKNFDQGSPPVTATETAPPPSP